MKDYDASTLRGTAELSNFTKLHAEAIVGHPLMVFRLIRRFAITLPRILKSLDPDSGNFKVICQNLSSFIICSTNPRFSYKLM